MADLQQLQDQIVGLSLLDAAQLVKALEDQGLVVELEVWDAQAGKGIDDLLAAGKQPTVVTGVTPDMAIAREEVFGPVLSVLTFGSLDEAVELANGTLYGL